MTSDRLSEEAQQALDASSDDQWRKGDFAFMSERQGRWEYIQKVLLLGHPNADSILLELAPRRDGWSRWTGD